MFRTRWLVSFALLLPLVAGPVHSRSDTGRKRAAGLELHKNLQRDPLLVLGMWLDDPATGLQGLAGMLEQFTRDAGAPVRPGSIGTAWASEIRSQVLSRLGSELVLVVDLPPVDEAVAAMQFSKDDALATLLERVGLVARVRDEAGLDRELRQWVLGAGGDLATADGMVEAAVPVGIAQDAQVPAVSFNPGATGSGIASITFIPEPSTALLLGFGLIGLAARRHFAQ